MIVLSGGLRRHGHLYAPARGRARRSFFAGREESLLDSSQYNVGMSAKLTEEPRRAAKLLSLPCLPIIRLNPQDEAMRRVLTFILICQKLHLLLLLSLSVFLFPTHESSFRPKRLTASS